MNGRTNSAGGALVSDMEIPLDPCTNFVGVRIKDLEYLGKVRLTWTDPKDKYATPEGEAMEDTDQLVSKWSYTQIVRQADRAPVNPSDGDTVCTETTRNQYQVTGFVDTTTESNVTYYYGAYAFNEDGVYSEVISNGVQPVSFSTTLADNTWEEIDQACTLGLAESLWEIGDKKTYIAKDTMSHTSDMTYTTVIVDFNHDDLADGSGKASITFLIRGSFGSIYPEYCTTFTDSEPYKRANQNYEYCISQELRSIIKPVIKQNCRIYEGAAGYHVQYYGITKTNMTCNVFCFGYSEFGGKDYDFHSGFDPSIEGSGTVSRLEDPYTGADVVDGYLYPYFATVSNWKIFKTSTDYNLRFMMQYNLMEIWWNTSGTFTYTSYDSSVSTAVVVGFCIGKVAV